MNLKGNIQIKFNTIKDAINFRGNEEEFANLYGNLIFASGHILEVDSDWIIAIIVDARTVLNNILVKGKIEQNEIEYLSVHEIIKGRDYYK